jgi:hypothetical protein
MPDPFGEKNAFKPFLTNRNAETLNESNDVN